MSVVSTLKPLKTQGFQKLLRGLLKNAHGNVLKPLFKAFVFAYLYVVLPKVLNHGIVSIRKGKASEIFPRTARIMLNAFHPKKFPFFAAKLVMSVNVLEPLVYRVLRRGKHPLNALFLSTFASSLILALCTFPRYQNHILGYGRYFSLDLTVLLATRAFDTALSSSLGKILPPSFSEYGDGMLFISSCTFIMYSWFFAPEKLPPAYSKWITSAANMDTELLMLLKGLKERKYNYGSVNPDQERMGAYCERYGEDPKRIDLSYGIPVDCEVVHAFKTKSCELHALWRFWRGFEFALKLYGPLNALMLLIPKKNASMRLRIIRAFKSSVRSSCFLGAFIGLYWYAVCLARTRLFPRLFPNTPKTRWDVTIGPTAGAVLCGFSSFIETALRRKELALFVAPRALGTFAPTETTSTNLKLESLVFSLSLATLVAYSKSDASKVRGIFGRGLQQVFHIASSK